MNELLMKEVIKLRKKLISFEPVLPEKPKVLILGSMPSKISLEKQQYYANPRNHFWPILFELFKQKPFTSYDDKIQFVKDNGIALWDTIGSCYREGSLDKNIIEEQPNDIKKLLTKHPTIKLIACNGTKSFQTFKKNIHLHPEMNIDIIKLPSSSPIPGRYTKSFTEKVQAWEQLLEYL